MTGALEASDVRTTRRTLLTVAAAIPAVQVVGAFAQYAGALPPGFVAAEVDNQLIDGLNTPLTPNLNPVISGRTNTGAAEVVVAIADSADVVQVFSLPVDGKGRFKGPTPEALTPGTYQLYFSDSLVGSFVIDGEAEAPDKEKGGSGTDIAQAVALPQDFGGAVANLGVLEGQIISLEREARNRAAAGGDTSKEAVDAQKQLLKDSGWRQLYSLRLAVPDPADASRFLVQVNGFAVEFETPEQAAALFPEIGAPNAAIDGPVIGEQTSWAEFAGITNDTEVPYRAMLVSYQQGSIVGRTVYADLSGGAPDMAMMTTVAERVVGRMAAIQEKGATGLGAQMARIDDSTGLVSVDEAYDWLNGELTPLYQESEKSLANRLAMFSPAVAAFTSAADVQAGETSIGGRYVTSLLSFASPEQAVGWLDGIPAMVEDDPLTSYTAIAAVDAAPVVGDASVAYAVSRAINDQEGTGFRIYTVQETAGAIVEFVGVPEATIDEAVRLATAQLTCAGKGKCAAAALPGSPEAAEEAAKQAEGTADGADSGKDKKDKKDKGASPAEGQAPSEGGVQDVPVDGADAQAAPTASSGVQDVPADGGSTGGVQDVPADGGSTQQPASGGDAGSSSGGTSIAPARTKTPAAGGVVDVTPAP